MAPDDVAKTGYFQRKSLEFVNREYSLKIKICIQTNVLLMRIQMAGRRSSQTKKYFFSVFIYI